MGLDFLIRKRKILTIYKEHDSYPYIPAKCSQPELSEFCKNSEFTDVINDCLLNTKGLALEIGGPTKKGYLLLNNVKFPNKLVISNAYPENSETARMDVTTKLPFEDDSVGCVISSCLPVIDLSNPLRDAREINLVLRNINSLADDVSTGKYDKLHSEAFANISPRIALIRESCRVLEGDGLFVIKSLLKSELKIIQDLGFEEVASVQYSLSNNDSIWMQKEYVFKLSNFSKQRTVGKAALCSMACQSII